MLRVFYMEKCFPRDLLLISSCGKVGSMGEVKVNVNMSNSIDVGMFRRGLIPRDHQQLGFETVLEISSMPADGSTQTVEQTEAIDMEILGRIVPEACLVLGSEVLIRQTALEATDLLVDCNRQKVIPHPDHPHATVIRIR